MGPTKEIKLIRTEVFKNPFGEAKEADPVALWFSNRADPMESHTNRHSSSVGKYLVADITPLPGEKRKQSDVTQLPQEELEYASVAQKAKKARTSFDFSKVF